MSSPAVALVAHICEEHLENLSLLPDNFQTLLDLLQGEHLLSSPQLTLDSHKLWQQRVIAALRHKQASVRCCALALVELSLTATLPLGSEAEIINAWSAELPEMFRRAISPTEIEAAAAAMHAITSAALRNAEARRDLLTLHLAKLMAALQGRLENDLDRVTSGVLEFVALLLRSLKASARPYLSKLDVIARELLRHHEQSVRDAACRIIAASTLCTVDDSWSGVAARAVLTLELQMDLLAVPEEEDSNRLMEKKQRLSQIASTLFTSAANSDAKLILEQSETCVRLLRTLLESCEVGVVNFPLRDVLRLLGRVLNWRVSSTAPPSEMFSLATTVPRAQAVMLRLMKLLLSRMSEKLHRDAEVLFLLLLRLTSTSTLGVPMYLQIRAHSTLQRLLHSFGSSTAQFISPLATLLHDQLSPPRTDAANAASAQRKRKKKATAQEVATTSAVRAQEAEKLYSEVDLLVERLKTLHSLLLHAGQVLSRKHRIELDQVILTLLSHASAERTLLPYAYPPFRLSLYRVLFASLLSPLDTSSPLLPFAMHYFSLGLGDCIPQVSEFCAQGVAVCSARLNPRPSIDTAASAAQGPVIAPPPPPPSHLFPDVASNNNNNNASSAPTSPLLAPKAPPPQRSNVLPVVAVAAQPPAPAPAPTPAAAPPPPPAFELPPPAPAPAPTKQQQQHSNDDSAAPRFQLAQRNRESDSEDAVMAEIVDRSPDASSNDDVER